jgi:hypothetical protein
VEPLPPHRFERLLEFAELQFREILFHWSFNRFTAELAGNRGVYRSA